MDTVLCVYHHWPIGGMSSFAAAVNDDAGASLCSEVTLMVEAGERFDIALYSAPYSPGGTARIQVEFLDRSPAPAWKATSLAGERVGSSSFLGNVVLLNIWATWCPPCIAETPALVKLQEKYRDYGFTVVGVSMDSPAEGGPPLPQRVGDFVTAKGINYPVLLEYPAGTIRNAYGYVALPTSYVIDRSGNIVDFWTGAALDDASNLARFERAIRPHLGIVPVITGTRTGDGKLELSWPDVTDAVLESRRFLSDSWAANFARVTISNGRAQVNLPIDARSQFFRLRTQ
jgi:thiol-disulfide isomerase/thioredoxin